MKPDKNRSPAGPAYKGFGGVRALAARRKYIHERREKYENGGNEGKRVNTVKAG